MVKHLEKESDFESITSTGKILVDFYADWCGPCKMLAPILEELNSIDVLKVNTDEFPDLAQKFGVMSIPTLIFMKDGKEVRKEIGFKPKEELEQIISEI